MRNSLKVTLITIFFIILPISILSKDLINVRERMIYRRAVEVAIWAMPVVGMREFYKGLKKDLNANWNDIVYFSKPLNSRHRFLTPNNQTPYVIASISTKKAPVILYIPKTSDKIKIFGSLVDCWDYPFTDVGEKGTDKGKGGKYLLLPPNYKEKFNKKGYFVFKPKSFAIYMALRLVVRKKVSITDLISYIKSIKIFYLKDSLERLNNKYIDAFPKKLDTLPKYNLSYYQDISDVINEEPVEKRDLAVMGILSSIGIQKGKIFNPDKKVKKIFSKAIIEAYNYMQWMFVNKAFKKFYKLSFWSVFNLPLEQLKKGWPFETNCKLLIDERANLYHYAIFLPKKLGADTFYLATLYDSKGKFLNGKSIYKLHIQPNVPVKNFWSVVAYSIKDYSFIPNAKNIGISSLDKNLIKNRDGSVDIYFSPSKPNKNVNWIQTGKNFWLVFRFYGPKKELFTKEWKLNDVKKIK